MNSYIHKCQPTVPKPNPTRRIYPTYTNLSRDHVTPFRANR